METTEAREQHEVCEVNVEVPTILVKSLREDREPETLVQWFGKSQSVDLSKKQFLFPVPLPPTAPNWWGCPEKFKVIFLGQFKDWPKKESAQKLVTSMTGNDNLEQWVLWVTSDDPSYCSEYRPEVGESPACFAIHMSLLLADHVNGIITPASYSDITVLDRANAIYAAENKRVAEAGDHIYENVQCPRCKHRGAYCIGTSIGSHWMTMQCELCARTFETDGE